jgi:CubicO group peptidase (beta-lactamase class C family)
MTRTTIRWLPPLLTLLVGAPADAQLTAIESRVDAVFAQYDVAGSPGCALGVIQDGMLAYERGYGEANLDYALPNSPAMVYYVGSVSKQFTAASIALLAQEGGISLDDDVRKYIPELPDYGRPITIRHLVHHTSGVRDIYGLMSLAGIRMEDVLTDEDALRLIARQKELNFQPGEAYLYSNSGYWLLGQIIERVTGLSLREYAREKIFVPLGMRNTHFHDEPGHVLPNRVISYAPADGSYRITYLGNFDKVGAGGLYTTVGDLLRWDRNFYEPRVGGDAFLRQMHTRGVLMNGDTLNYALGLVLGEYRGLRTVRHGGSLMGFRAELVRFPDERFSVIVLCNLGTIDATGLADRIADIYLEDRLAPVAARPGARPTAAAARGDATPQAFRVDSAALAAYAGEYASQELDVRYRLVVAGERLVLHRRTHAPTPLEVDGPETFRGADLVLRFTRAADGGISGFTIQAGRVRNIRFDRTR